MELPVRVYTIEAGEGRRFHRFSVVLQGRAMRLEWMENDTVQLPRLLKIDGDEREILSAAMTVDRQQLEVRVAYQPPRPSHISLSLTELLPQTTIHLVESRGEPVDLFDQDKIQEIVQCAKESFW